MMRKAWMIGLGVMVLAGAVTAQNPPAGAPPAGGQRGGGAAGAGGRGGGRGPALVSPEVSPDRKITLRYSAPNAQQVTASGELDGQPHPMTKGDNGIWSVTIGPL